MTVWYSGSSSSGSIYLPTPRNIDIPTKPKYKIRYNSKIFLPCPQIQGRGSWCRTGVTSARTSSGLLFEKLAMV